MRLQFIGSGDAFGSGGRFNTCFHLTGPAVNVLIDCGATALVALRRLAVDCNAIDTILITHFHGDHFGGIPNFILHAQLVAKRTRPLLIAGPPGLPEWYERLFNATYPGERKLPFRLQLREVEIGRANDVGALKVTPVHVRHDDRAGPCLAYRIEAVGKVLCFSGDTEWTDTLIAAASGADLFVCECYTYDQPRRAHLNLATLREKLPLIGAKRVVLTHMSDDMLARLGDLPEETAADGAVIEF